MTLTIPKCKNDQSREGNVIHISELNSKCWPVFNLAMYIHTLGLGPNDYLICKLAKTKKGHNAIGHHKMSDSHIRKNFKEMVKQHLPHTTNISPHSLRSGLASAAPENGTSDRMISKHGRWKSGLETDISRTVSGIDSPYHRIWVYSRPLTNFLPP